VDAFDADVLIFAATPDHPMNARVLALFPGAPTVAGIGSVLLLPELLSKPRRESDNTQLGALMKLLGQLDLRPVDEATAELAVALGASYRLKALDAVHLATAVAMSADRFLTNNHRDFPRTISEIEITYPDELAS
jgi:predicted nucleic acid-binding protein